MAAVLMEGQAERVGSVRLRTAAVLTGIVLVAIVMIRLTGLTETTAFFDEALYTLIGRKILLQIPEYPAIRWITGSYLYPLVAGQASLLFNDALYGVRLVSVVSSTLAALAVYATTARLMNTTAAFLSLIVFGFTGVSIFVGQLGTYDALGIACLAGAVCGLAYGVTEAAPAQQARYLALGGVAFALSLLSKYVAAFFLPVGGLLLLGLLASGRGPVAGRILRYFAFPAALIFGGYALLFRDDLLVMLGVVQTLTSQPASRLVIAQEIIRDLRFPTLLALIGGGHLLYQARPGYRREIPAWRVWLVPLCWGAAAIFPIYHLLTANIRSLDKHMAYALVFLAPLAGWGIYQLFQFVHQRVRAPAAQTLVLGLGIAGLLVGIDKELDRTWSLNHAWPDKTATLYYLAQQPILRGTRILAEGADVYTFHLNWQGSVDVESTWSFFYGGRSGVEAMQQGIADHYFQYLIFDNYFTPEVSAASKAAALRAGYQQVFQHTDLLGSGVPVITEIYALPSTAGGSGAGAAAP